MSESNGTELRIGPDAHIDPAPIDNSPPPEVDPQGEVRLSIAEKYEQRRLEEIEAQREQMGLPPTEAEPPETDAILPHASEPERVEPTTIVQSEAPAPVPIQPTQPQLHPVQTPDGRTFYCTIEQIAQLAGIGAASAVAQPQAPPQPASQPQPTHQPSFDTERARTIANRLSFGDPEEQARALTEFAQEIRPQAVDPVQMRQQIKQELTAEMQVERDLHQIGTEFASVFNNRYATVAAAAAVNDLRANPYWASRSPLEVYREACTTVARDFNLGSPQSQPGLQQTPAALQAAPVQSQTARIERKRAAPSIPVATDRRVAMADDAPREPTPSEVVDQIRKSRHQPSLR